MKSISMISGLIGVLSLLATSTTSFADSSKEEIHGYSVENAEVSFVVTSNGCTDKNSFEVSVTRHIGITQAQKPVGAITPISAHLRHFFLSQLLSEG